MTSNMEELTMPTEGEDDWMDEEKFAQKWTYSLRSDFISSSGVPAAWAPGNPQYWGQENARIRLDGEAVALALSHDDKLLAVGIEKDIHVFCMANRKCIDVLKGHPGQVVTLQFSPGFDPSENTNYQYLLVSQSDEEDYGEVNTVMIWDLDQTGQELLKDTSTEISNGKLQFEGHLGSFQSPVFSTDLKHLIYVAQNMTAGAYNECQYSPSVNLWDVETRSLRCQLSGHTDAVVWVGFSPDNLLAASTSLDGTARVWDVITGVCLQTITPQGDQLWCGAFSPDSKYLAIGQGSQTRLLVYEISTGRTISSAETPRIDSMAWSPDSSLIAVGLENGTLNLFDPYTRAEKMRWSLGFDEYLMQSFASIRGVQFIDKGKKLVFQIIEGTVEVYDFETNLKLQFTRGPGVKTAKCPHAQVVCSRNSKFLVVADVDWEVRIWNL